MFLWGWAAESSTKLSERRWLSSSPGGRPVSSSRWRLASLGPGLVNLCVCVNLIITDLTMKHRDPTKRSLRSLRGVWPSFMLHTWDTHSSDETRREMRTSDSCWERQEMVCRHRQAGVTQRPWCRITVLTEESQLQQLSLAEGITFSHLCGFFNASACSGNAAKL